MFRLMSVICLCLLVGSATAQEAVIKLVPSSTVYLKIVTDAQGKPTITEMPVFTPSGVPTNPPPTNPPPTDPTSIQPSVRTITLDTLSKPGATKQTAAGLSAAFSLVSKGVADNSLPVTPKAPGEPPQCQLALDLALKTVLLKATEEEKPHWAHWRTSVSTVLTQMANNGDLSTKAQWTKVLNEVHLGIDQATGIPIDVDFLVTIDPRKAGILDGITLKDIIELIKLLLEIFSQFKM